MSSILDKEDVLKAFSEGLEAFATRTRRSQAELADTAGVVQSNVSHWLRARTMPSLQVAANLLAAGMALDEVFGKDLAAKVMARDRNSTTSGDGHEDPAAVVRSGLQALLDGLR